MQAYVPFAQSSSADFTLIVRGAGDRIAPALPGLVRTAIAGVDARLPTHELRPLAGLVGDSVLRQRFAATLFAVFSLVALLLAAVGIYGVVSQGVLRRRQELGIRMALGADGGSVVRLVVIEAGRLLGLGIGLGLVGAVLLTGLLDRLLFGVSAAGSAELPRQRGAADRGGAARQLGAGAPGLAAGSDGCAAGRVGARAAAAD